MSEPKPLSPLLDGLEFGANVFSEGSKSTYLMRNPKSGTVYLLRIFTVPESTTQMDALIYSGAVADRAEALRYYTDQLIELRRDLETIKGFGDYPGIQAQVGYQIDELPDEQGFSVYVLSEYHPSLSQHLTMNAMNMLDALNLGIDLCDALFSLHESGYLVQTISPDNIVITPQNRFALSNISLAELDRLPFYSISADKLSETSAPELFGLIPSFQPNSDLYSVGMVLYYIFNGNHNPFVDERTTTVAANKRRLDGETLPVPMYADYELSEILLKACAFNPKDRYQSPDELKAALMQYMQRNPVTDALIVPPIYSQPEDVIPASTEDEAEPISFADADALDDDFIAHLSPSQDSAEGYIAPEHGDEVTESETESTSSRRQSAVKRQKKRGRIAAVLGVVVFLAIVAFLLWLLLKPNTLELTGLTITETTADHITVVLPQPETECTLELVCSDAYGNVQRKSYQGGAITFDGLSSGTQYSITVETSDRLRLTGSTSVNATTIAATSLTSITATELSGDSVTLVLTTSNDMPDAWKITCTSVGQEPMEHSFSGNSIQINGLTSNTTYTCTFEDASGAPVSGENSITFTTEPRVVLESFTVAESSATSVTLEWNYSGDRPTSWSILCEGSDGSVKEQQVSGLSTTFDDISSDVSYTFTISTVGMEESQLATLQVSTLDIQISELTAEAQSPSSIAVSWAASGNEEDAVWSVLYRVSGSNDEALTIQTTETSVLLTDLIPQTGYSIEIQDAEGHALSGTSSVFSRTEIPEKYTDHGCKQLYTALYLEPSRENWTISNLASLRTSFSSDEGIALAIESISGIQSAEEEMSVLYVIRDRDGKPVSSTRKTTQWNDLWTGDVLVDSAPDTPQDAGSYTLEVYLNDKLLASMNFTIT